MSGHAVPFYCAYCGEEDIEPVGEHGGWACNACLRTFRLVLLETNVRTTAHEEAPR